VPDLTKPFRVNSETASMLFNSPIFLFVFCGDRGPLILLRQFAARAPCWAACWRASLCSMLGGTRSTCRCSADCGLQFIVARWITHSAGRPGGRVRPAAHHRDRRRSDGARYYKYNDFLIDTANTCCRPIYVAAHLAAARDFILHVSEDRLSRRLQRGEVAEHDFLDIAFR